MAPREKEGTSQAGTQEHSPITQRQPSTHSTPPGTITPSSSSFLSLRIIILALSALALYISTQVFSSRDTTSYPSSSSSSSPPSTKQHLRRGDAQIRFGVPTEQLFSSPASSGHQFQEQEQQRQEHQKQQKEQERQQRQQNPFGDFFGQQEEPEAQQGYDEACPGYVCSEGGACVEKPLYCPCPYELDTKCFRGDWYVCHRGDHPC
ncbi:hypothetical protein MVEG_06583 [Podila verticillata NRRL 6337]|nr:hypothetical protein MVEG_06583 [Podila verticillata NRRL 6337]